MVPEVEPDKTDCSDEPRDGIPQHITGGMHSLGPNLYGRKNKKHKKKKMLTVAASRVLSVTEFGVDLGTGHFPHSVLMSDNVIWKPI